MWRRDQMRLAESLARIRVSPLGAAALAGTTFPIDPEFSACQLGFPEVFRNSLDAVSDRDFILEFLAHAAIIMVHLSRLSEELIIWASAEFGFIALPDSYATGSSIMPQKKNPDVAELIRGKCGRVTGHLMSLLMTVKGLPLAYNRDLQEDKEPLFDSFDTVDLALEAVRGLLASSTFVVDAMRAAADAPTVAATDLAEWLVERGVPFREAHAVVGALVRESLEEGVPLGELLEGHGDFGIEALRLLEEGEAVRRRRTAGGAGPDAVGPQLERFRAHVAARRDALREQGQG
jgi:argininosuccinate lyase